MKTVEMRAITKRFGDIMANNSVQFSAFSGEIHGLIGENGAGKSTLMKILAGMYRPDGGEIDIDGKRVHIRSAQAAQRLGIAMVYQRFSLVEALTGLENVILGSEPGGFFLRGIGDTEKSVRELCGKFGFTFDVSATVSDLTVGEKQQLEIVKVLFRGAELLILDEPTSLLAPPEVEPFFRIIRTLRSEGKVVVFISHKLEEVLDVADRITVMRKGRVVAAGEKRLFSRDKLADMIVGVRPESSRQTGQRRRTAPGEAREKLRVDRLALVRNGREVMRNVSFSLRRGEILGVAGVVGNGQSELAEVLGGLIAPTSGRIMIDGRIFTKLTPALARQAGIAHIPENTREHALVEDMSIAENAFLGTCRAPRKHRGALMNLKQVRETASRLVSRYEIRPSNPDAPLRELSGGNQQKVVIARELSWMPSIVVAAYPTRGLDLGTRLFLHDEFLRLRRKGAAVLLISADLEEVLKLSDRVLVFYAGETQGPFGLDGLTENRLGLLMTGSHHTQEPTTV